MLTNANVFVISISLLNILNKVQATVPQYIDPSSPETKVVIEGADTSTCIYIVEAIDNDGDVLTYSKHSQIPKSPSFTFDPASRKLYPPAGLDAQTTTSFAIEFSVTDGNSTVISPVLTINIQDVNGHGNNQTSYITSIFGTALSGNMSNIGINDPCLPNPCENSGNCSVVGTSYQCQCSSNYSGKNCTDEAETGKDNSLGDISIYYIVIILGVGVIMTALILVMHRAVHNYHIYIYGLDWDGISFLARLLKEDLQPETQEQTAIAPVQKVKIALRYFVSGKNQLHDADMHDIPQPSASIYISEVIEALSKARNVQKYISFSKTQEDIQDFESKFYDKASFPNVFGVIGVMHVQLQAPTQDAEANENRMNVQVVFDPYDRVIDMVARRPGSVHRSSILGESGMWGLLERDGGHLLPGHHYLLGDSGYPCKRWHLTPYLNPQSGSQTQYNRAHTSTRAKAEEGIGQLKRRWGILHAIMSPEKVCKLILCCGVLHNISQLKDIPKPLDILHNGHNDQPQTVVKSGPRDGFRYRDFIAETFF